MKTKKYFLTIFILLFLINLILFPETKSITIHQSKKNYSSVEIQNIELTIKDILSKEIFLFTDGNIVNLQNIELNYKNAKQHSLNLLNKYGVDIFLTYTVEYYKTGIIIQFFIYDKNIDKIFIEKKIYSEKEDIYKSVNEILDTLYTHSLIKETVKKRYLDKKNYDELVIFNEKIIEDKKSKIDTFKNYDNKDNIYINISYISRYLKESNIEKSIEVLENIKKIITENNHINYYINGVIKKTDYKKYVREDDIKESINLIKKAIEKKKKNYIYYYTLAEIYELYGDYTNAIENYKNSINIFVSTNTLKNLIFILKKDMSKNRDEVIDYSKEIIQISPDDEETVNELIKIYDESLDYENALYYNEKLLSIVEKEIVKINNNQLGASLLYRYTQRQKSTQEKIKYLKNILEKEKSIIK